MKYGLIFLSCFLLSNCSADIANNSNKISQNTNSQEVSLPAPSKNNTAAIFKNKLKEVATLIDLDCNRSNQCKVIGVGVSPCGGFASYSVYSEKNTDVNKLKENIAQFNHIMSVQNKKNNLVGICRHIEPPKTSCMANKCISATKKVLF